MHPLRARSKRRAPDPVDVTALDPDLVIARLEPLLLPRRVQRMREVLDRRSAHVTFVFEDMVDPHNLRAAMRSMEGFGFQELYLVNPAARVGFARKISKGTERWLTVHDHESIVDCVEGLKAKGYRVLASHVAVEDEATGDLEAAPAQALDTIDFAQPTALLFGNEHAGVTELALKLADGTFRIDMLGFVESLNLSVACAICAHAARQAMDRMAGESGDPRRFALPEPQRKALYAQWLHQSVRAADRVLADRTKQSL